MNHDDLFSFGPVVLYSCRNDERWSVIYISPNVSRHMGYLSEDFITGKINLQDVVYKKDVNRIKEEIRNQLEDGSNFIKHKPYRLVTKNGDIKWVKNHTEIIRNDEGQVLSFNGYVYDVTEQMMEELELREIKARYESLLLASREGIWDWDLRSNEVYYSERWHEILGIHDEPTGTLSDWESRVHEEDLDRCYAEIEKHLKGESDVYEHVHRMRHENGFYLYILEHGVRVLNDEGIAYRMIGTSKDITDEVHLKEKLVKLSREDELTGLNNRRAFYDIFEKELLIAKRYDHHVGFALLDLDDFKLVNDRYGHFAGDAVLKQFAKILKSHIRKSDYAFRIGGEEFGILVVDTTEDAFLSFLERLKKVVSEYTFNFDGGTCKITVSMGVVIDDGKRTRDELFNEADTYLYQAKSEGKNRIEIKGHNE